MNRLRYFFVILILSSPFFTCAGDGFVYLKDTTQKLFFVSDANVYSPDKAQLLYSQRGNIFYAGNGDGKDNISLLVTSLDPASTKLETIFEKDQRQPVYSFQDNRFFLGKPTSEETQQKNELLHIEASKKWLGFYSSDNDSLLAYYRIDSFPSSVAIIVAYTLIKQFGLEKNIKAAQPQSKINGLMSFIKNITGGPALQSVTGAYSVIKPASGNTMANEWIWDGKILRPRWNTDQSLAWTFDGQTIKRMYAENNNDQYTWDGKTFKPLSQDDLSQQWSWDGSVIKRAENTGWHNEYMVNDGVVRPTTEPGAENEWHLDGSIPVPLVILIISGIAKAE